VILLLIVHLLLGFRRLRELDYYRDDPIVLRLMGLRRLPDVATISRALMQIDADGGEQVRRLSRNMVLEALQREQFPWLTFGFDGSVESTMGHAEGTAMGFNKNKKGARSYYDLFCTVAQTGQFFDRLHRPGNVNDSNGVAEFIRACFTEARAVLKNTIFEYRMGADPKLLNQQLGTVPIFQVKLYDPQPELHRKSQRSALPLHPGCRTLGCARHRVTSSLCKWFLHSGVSPNFLRSS
jgi:hypothetical protein